MVDLRALWNGCNSQIQPEIFKLRCYGNKPIEGGGGGVPFVQ